MIRFRTITHSAFIVPTCDSDLDVTVGRQDKLVRVAVGQNFSQTLVSERIIGTDGYGLLSGIADESRDISMMAEVAKTGLVNSTMGVASASSLSFVLGLGWLNPIALALGAAVGAASGGLQLVAIERGISIDKVLDDIGRMARRYLDTDAPVDEHFEGVIRKTGQEAFKLGGDVLKVFVAFHMKLVEKGKVAPW